MSGDEDERRRRRQILREYYLVTGAVFIIFATALFSVWLVVYQETKVERILEEAILQHQDLTPPGYR